MSQCLFGQVCFEIIRMEIPYMETNLPPEVKEKIDRLKKYGSQIHNPTKCPCMSKDKDTK